MRDLDLRNVRAIVTDAEVLGRLEPDAVADYLARNGWIASGGRRTGTVWSRELDSTRAAAVFVPDDQTYADYAVRMGELLTMLARVEDRSQLAILADLQEAAEHDSTTGVERIAAERQRLIEVEGYDATHDDRHDGGELIEAARCYVYAALVAEHADLAEWFGLDAEGRFKLPHPANARWPWAPADWKPTGDPVRELATAGAFIVAEIERLLRKAAREGRA